MSTDFLLAALGASAVTIALRVSPILLLSRLTLPSWLSQWLRFVPLAIMTALVVISILTAPVLSPGGWNISALAAGVCVVVGILSRSLLATVLIGVIVFIALQATLP